MISPSSSIFSPAASGNKKRKSSLSGKYDHIKAKVPTLKQARQRQNDNLANSTNLQQQQQFQQMQQQKRQRDDTVKQMWARIDALTSTQEQRWPSQGATTFLTSAGSAALEGSSSAAAAKNSTTNNTHHQMTVQEMAALSVSRKAKLDELAQNEEVQNKNQIDKFSAGGYSRAAVSHATDFPPEPVIHTYNAGPFVNPNSSHHQHQQQEKHNNNTSMNTNTSSTITSPLSPGPTSPSVNSSNNKKLQHHHQDISATPSFHNNNTSGMTGTTAGSPTSTTRNYLTNTTNPAPPATWIEHSRFAAQDLSFADYLYARYLFSSVDLNHDGFIRLHDLVQFRLQNPTKMPLSAFEHLSLKGDGKVYIDEWVSMFFPNILKSKISSTIREYEGAFNLPFVCLSGGQKMELRKMYEKLIVNEQDHDKLVLRELDRMAKMEEERKKREKFKAFGGHDESDDEDEDEDEDGEENVSSDDDDADISSSNSDDDNDEADFSQYNNSNDWEEAQKRKKRRRIRRKRRLRKQREEEEAAAAANAYQIPEIKQPFAHFSAKLLDRCHTTVDSMQTSAALLVNRLKELKSLGRSTLDGPFSMNRNKPQGGAIGAIKAVARLAKLRRRFASNSDDGDDGAGDNDDNDADEKELFEDSRKVLTDEKGNSILKDGKRILQNLLKLEAKRNAEREAKLRKQNEEAENNKNGEPTLTEEELDDLEFAKKYASEVFESCGDFGSLDDNNDINNNGEQQKQLPQGLLSKLTLPTSWRVKAKEAQEERERRDAEEERERKQRLEQETASRRRLFRNTTTTNSSGLDRSVTFQDDNMQQQQLTNKTKNSQENQTDSENNKESPSSGNMKNNSALTIDASPIRPTPTSHVIISSPTPTSPLATTSKSLGSTFSSTTLGNTMNNKLASPTTTTKKNTNNISATLHRNTTADNDNPNNIYSTSDGSPTPLSPAPHGFTPARLSLLDFFELLFQHEVVFSPCEVIHLMKWRGGTVSLALDDVCCWMAKAAVAGNQKSMEKQKEREERRRNNEVVTIPVIDSSSPSGNDHLLKSATSMNVGASLSSTRRRRSSIIYGRENNSFETDLQKSIDSEQDPLQKFERQNVVLDYFEAFHLIQEQLSSNPFPKYHADIRNNLIELVGNDYLQLLSRWVAQKQIHAVPMKQRVFTGSKRKGNLIEHLASPPPPTIEIDAEKLISNLVNLCPQCHDRTTAICISIAAGAKTVEDRKAAQSEAALKSLLTSRCSVLAHPILLLSAFVPFNSFQLLNQQLVACPERVMNTLPTVLTPAAALQVESLEIFRDSCVAGGKAFDLPNKETTLQSTYVDELLAESRNHVSDLFRKVRQKQKTEKAKQERQQAFLKREEEQKKRMMTSGDGGGSESNSIVTRLEANFGNFQVKSRWK